MRSTGLLVILIGVAVIVVGALIWAGALSWFGRLPGDIRHEGESARVYVPVTSMLVVSVVLSVAAYLLRRFFR
jgi:flagellar basal body-associated protein FliL